MWLVERLWSALEDRPRLRGVRQDIKDRLGPDYEFAVPFLTPSGKEARRYPCDFPSSPGCPRRIIKDPDGSIRAVCGCTPKECHSVVLSADDIKILRFDDSRFARTLQRQLGISGEYRSDASGDLITLGTITPATGKRLPVVLMMAASCQEAEVLTVRTERKYRQGAVLLTPTDQYVDPETEGRLLGSGLTWLVLAELLTADSSKLIAARKLVDVMRSGGRTRPASVLLEAAQRRRRGFAPNAEDHQKVVEAVAQVGDGWSFHLDEVCRQLQIVAAAFPKSPRKEGFDSWDDLAEDILGPGNSSTRERVAGYIRYRLKWLRSNQSVEKSLTKVSR
jgi:hypothetical protein